MRNELKKILVLGTVLSLSIGPVLAQGRGGGGMGASVGGGIGHSMGGAGMGGQGGMNGRFGGQSEANISAQGRANTNGPVAADRDFGSARAADRMDTRANGRSELGGLNADHASDTARAHAASGSRVGEIGTYETRMKSALAISDPVARNAAITRARQDLALTTNKPLTSGAISRLDSDLQIRGASPRLGASH